MTQDILSDVGEEYLVETNVNGDSHDHLLYLDSGGDNLSETDNLAAISTEPTNSNYARQTSTVTTAQLSGDYGWDNDSSLSWDFSDQTSSQTVDTGGIVANFQSSVAGDGSASDNLIGNPALSQDRDIGSIDSLDVAAGGLEVTVN